jgi:hypothetical protein
VDVDVVLLADGARIAEMTWSIMVWSGFRSTS